VAAILEGASRALAETSTSCETALELITRTAAEMTGGSCLLWLVNDTGREVAVAACYDEDPERLALISSTFNGVPQRIGDSLFAHALITSGPHTFIPVRWEELGLGDRDGRALSVEFGESALTMVPIRARSATPGLLGLITPAARGEIRELERALLQQLGDRVALAIDNARLLSTAESEIRQRRAADTVRLADEETIAVVSRSGPILLFACDGDGTILQMDGGLLKQFQRGSESLIGKNLLQVVDDYPLLVEYATRVLAGEQIRHGRFPVGPYSLETWATPLHRADGTVSGFAGIVVDASARVAAEAAVLEATHRQAALVEHASDVIVLMTPDGMIHYANPAVQRVLGYQWRSGDILDVLSLVHPDDRDRCRQAIRQAIRSPGVHEAVEYRMRHADGSYRVLQSIGNNLLDDPAVAGFVITLRDVTAERAGSERLRLNADRQAALAELGRWALVGFEFADLVTDAVKVLTEQSGADFVHVFEALPDADFLSLSTSAGHATTAGDLLSVDPTSSPASFALVTQQTVLCDDLECEKRFDVPELWTSSNALSVIEVPITGQDMPVGVLGIGSVTRHAFGQEDVDFVKAVANVLAVAVAHNRAESAVRQQALQDPLTGLANRMLLSDRVTVSSAATGNLLTMGGAERTVLVLDVDRFKEINDTLGHGIGDLVLLEIARRLRRVGDPVELVARLGGDEFALVARFPARDENALDARADEDGLANRVLSLLREPLDVGGVKLRLRGSIGIASADLDRDGMPLEVPALLRRAEAAMYQAKTQHQGVRRYSEDLERSSLSRLALASELAEAIDQGQLRLHYQPKVRCSDDVVTGVEALVRWQHPTRGLLAPDVFVPLAEQTGIIRELTYWVLSRALAECASWHRAGNPLPVAVNLSAGTVHDPALLDAVVSATMRAGLEPESLELDITESAVMKDPAGALTSLQALTSLGVRLALDDFGTGHSSFGYLQRLPVSSVKIDRAFVTPLGKSDASVARAIVRAIVELCHSLGLDAIAEGVDAGSVAAAVRTLGCDAMQGFSVARPMDAQALQLWMTDRGPPGGPDVSGAPATVSSAGAGASAALASMHVDAKGDERRVHYEMPGLQHGGAEKGRVVRRQGAQSDIEVRSVEDK
jgi:diguanylate cyclase (GGDEF)-like protein/PAS domain S-box-containing protein